MSFPRLLIIAIAAALALATATIADAQQPAPAAPAASPADAALAARFVDLAQTTLSGQAPDEIQFERAIALLEAARRLNPTEPRHLRLLADALIRTNDTAALHEVIVAYRKLPGRFEDRVAQLEYIDLLLSRHETVDDRLKLLTDLISREAVPREVRAEIAMRMAALYAQKKQPDEERKSIDQALSLEPTNLPALRAKWAKTFDTATPAQRLAMALAMVRSNPRQVDILTGIATDLAHAGLVKESVEWYGHAFTASTRQGMPIHPEVATSAAAQLFLNNQLKEARALLERLEAAGHMSYPTAILHLILERHEGNKEPAEKLLTTARNTLVNNVQTARAALGVKGAATQPIDAPRHAIPDLGADIALLKETDKPHIRAAYLQAVGDLAWFELFFNSDADVAQKLMAVLSAAQDPADKDATDFLTRLQGWVALRQAEVGIADRAAERGADATAKLTAIAERDPLAELGLIRLLLGTNKDQARARAQQLLSKYPHGVIAALILDSLRDSTLLTPREAGLLPADIQVAHAQSLSAELAKFPRDFMRILDAPQMFYALRLEPARIIAGFGDPLLVRVTLVNNSQYDLTIGDEGVIRPDLWFDALMVVGAAEPRPLPNVAVDRITEHTVLRPRQTLSRTVRLDRGDQIGAFLFLNPTPPVLFRISVKTNPIPTPRGAISGVCGYGAEMVRPMERTGSPLNEMTIKRTTDAALAGNGVERIRALELITSFSTLFRRSGQPDTIPKADALLEPVRKTRFDDNPSLRASAGFLLIAYGPENGRSDEVEKLLVDPAWQDRLMGLILHRALPDARMKPAVAELAEKDADPLVKRYAAATIEALKRPPATQPATQPADPTQPPTQPAGPLPGSP